MTITIDSPEKPAVITGTINLTSSPEIIEVISSPTKLSIRPDNKPNVKGYAMVSDVIDLVKGSSTLMISQTDDINVSFLITTKNSF